jgi:short-subunit dehydrogenase
MRAIVTGASGSVGAGVSRLLSVRGAEVILVGRDADRLAKLRAGIPSSEMTCCDLCEDTDVERLLASYPTADVLVNCAGATEVGRYVDRDWQNLEREITLNSVAVARLCRHYGAGMVERSAGRILNFASTAVYRPAPLISAYAASKAFVWSCHAHSPRSGITRV